jgi:hypothetical protein
MHTIVEADMSSLRGLVGPLPNLAPSSSSASASSASTATQALGLTSEEIDAPIKDLNKMLKLKGFSTKEIKEIKARRRTRKNR